ncbi:hypothetical protein FRAHR75_10211 [Frankia sp. Hr75.2]|nr:hypothetical protein FRAHR75_10211 [Frankia sp. Hr75.2]
MAPWRMKCQKSSACRCTLRESRSATCRATVVLPAPGGPVITITLPVVAPEVRADAPGRVKRGLLIPRGAARVQRARLPRTPHPRRRGRSTRRAVLLRTIVWDYREHGRTFPAAASASAQYLGHK